MVGPRKRIEVTLNDGLTHKPCFFAHCEKQFAVKDRILELELLNDQLRRGQAKAESETR